MLVDHFQAVSPFNRTALDDFRIDADIPLVILDGRSQDAVVFGQIQLSERRHDASATGAGDGKLYVTALQRLADPGLFDEALGPLKSVDQNVRTEALRLEAALWIDFVQFD